MKDKAEYELLGMVPVAPGSFFMGREERSTIRNFHDEPGHWAHFTYKFELGRYPVTNLVWSVFTGEELTEEPLLPKVGISWSEAAKFCVALNKHFGLDQPFIVMDKKRVELDLGANGFRLPTEAEWEYTADDLGNEEVAGDLSEYACSVRSVVGSKLPSDLGFYDQLGNVGEWCWNWYAEKYDTEIDSTGWITPDFDGNKVIRGVKNDDGLLGKTFRGIGSPDWRDEDTGFRLARTIIAEKKRKKEKTLEDFLDEVHKEEPY
jgi:formylglycine-generating enzyme required for sulfatase activity